MPEARWWWGTYSVWLRHAVLYRKTILVNCLPPVSEPVVYLLAFGYGLGPFIGSLDVGGEKVPYLEFIAPGMMAVGALFQGFIEGAYGTFVRVRFRRSWHTMLTAPLTYDEIFLGDCLWGATKGMIGGLLTGIVAALWGIYPWTGILFVVPALFVGGFVFTALGMASAGCAQTIDHLNIPLFLGVVPMFAVCGTYFPRTVLPDWIEPWVSALPLSALVDLVRSGGAGGHGIPLAAATLTTWAAVLGVIAWWSNRRHVIR